MKKRMAYPMPDPRWDTLALLFGILMFLLLAAGTGTGWIK